MSASPEGCEFCVAKNVCYLINSHVPPERFRTHVDAQHQLRAGARFER